jgi:hypothetical protein
MAIETAVADVRQEYEVCVSAYVKTIDKTINDKDELIASYKEQRLALRAQNTGFKRKADDPEKKRVCRHVNLHFSVYPRRERCQHRRGGGCAFFQQQPHDDG